VPTTGLPAGSYALVWEVGVAGQPGLVRHALPVTLRTQQSPPDIDFDRVTLLAVVLGDTPDTARQMPRVESTRYDGGTLVVSWRTEPASAVRGREPRMPFVVVGVTGHDGSVRFERVP
jgi:hypothetical protein